MRYLGARSLAHRACPSPPPARLGQMAPSTSAPPTNAGWWALAAIAAVGVGAYAVLHASAAAAAPAPTGHRKLLTQGYQPNPAHYMRLDLDAFDPYEVRRVMNAGAGRYHPFQIQYLRYKVLLDAMTTENPPRALGLRAKMEEYYDLLPAELQW